jgi:hypothetical protein
MPKEPFLNTASSGSWSASAYGHHWSNTVSMETWPASCPTCHVSERSDT